MKFQVNNLSFRKLGGESKPNPLQAEGKGIAKIRAESKKLKTEKQQRKINKTKTLFFEKINKINKDPSRLIKRIQITKLDKDLPSKTIQIFQ